MGNCAEGARSLFSLDEMRRMGDRRPDRVTRYHVNERIEDWYTLSNDPNEFHFGEPSTARMSLATRRGRRYAVKTMFKRSLGRGTQALPGETLRNEIQVYIRLDHPHVARLQDVFDMDDRICMVMELLEGGELFDRVCQGAFSEMDAADACYQMFTAVGYLHKQDPPILHRDLKPENFMYTRANSNVLKLIDFGQAALGAAAGLPLGTFGYTAPEVDFRLTALGQYTDKSDIFSLGVTAYILLTGHPPFAREHGAQRRCLEAAWAYETFRGLSAEAQSFLRAVMEYDFARRPTAVEALEHPWIRDREQPQMREARLAPEAMASLKGYASASRFKKACYRMMAASLTMEEQQQVCEIFKQADRSGDGKISLDEFRQVLEANYTINEETIRKLFRDLGEGGKEVISYTEFMAAIAQERLRMHEDSLRDVFCRLDKNGDGIISMQELQVALDTTFDTSEAEELVREIGVGADGQISIEAFIVYLQREDQHPDADSSQEGSRVSRAERRRVHFCLAAKAFERELEEEKRAQFTKSFSPEASRPRRAAPMVPRQVGTWAHPAR